MQGKFDPFVAEWISFVTNPNFNLVEKCLKFAQILEYPDLEIEKYIAHIKDQNKVIDADREKIGIPASATL